MPTPRHKRAGLAALAIALAGACAAGSGPAAAQSVMLDGRSFHIPEGVAVEFEPAPPGPGSEDPLTDGIAFRWPDGASVNLALRRPVEPFAELPPPGAVGDFGAGGIAPVAPDWARAAARAAGPAFAAAADGLRSYVVRTGNPAYPLARVLCAGRGAEARCRVYTRVGEGSVLSGELPSNDPAAVAAGVARRTSLLFDP